MPRTEQARKKGHPSSHSPSQAIAGRLCFTRNRPNASLSRTFNGSAPIGLRRSARLFRRCRRTLDVGPGIRKSQKTNLYGCRLRKTRCTIGRPYGATAEKALSIPGSSATPGYPDEPSIPGRERSVPSVRSYSRVRHALLPSDRRFPSR